MIEVAENIWVGSADDALTVEQMNQPGWSILTCAKEPFHRQALGYTTPGAPKDHPEYLFARRGNRLILNMVDADNPDFIPDAMVEEGLLFIHEALAAGRKILVHCNQGESRGPGMALLYLLTKAETPDARLLTARVVGHETLAPFAAIYPQFNPKAGIAGVIQRRLFKPMADVALRLAAESAGIKVSPADDSGDGWLMRMK